MSCVRRTRADTDIRHYQAQGKVRHGTPQLRIAARCSLFNPYEGAVHQKIFLAHSHNISDQFVKIKFVACAIVFT